MVATFNVAALVRPNVAALLPYRCARDDYETGVLLDANENSFGPAVTPAPGDPPELERYPDPHQKELKALVASFRGVQPDNVFVGVGSDEAIDLLIRVFCRPGIDSVVITPPTYGMYAVAAATNDVAVLSVPLTSELQLEPDKLVTLMQATPTAKLLFLCTPNNPGGRDVLVADVEQILEQCTSCLVVVDEAYVDFSGRPSLAPLVAKHANMVVLQTTSKSFGLAGIRCGTAFASCDVVALLDKVKAPYNMNRLTQSVALRAYAPNGIQHMRKNVAAILAEKAWLVPRIAAIPGVRRVLPSDANFFVAQVDNALAVYRAMASRGVVVRYRGNELHCKDGLRITVGTREQNEALLACLAEVLAKGC